MNDWKVPAIILAASLAMCCVAFFIGKDKGYKTGYNDGTNALVKTDTIWTVDTHYVDRPVEVTKWKDREKFVYVPVKEDSLVYVHDTTFIALEREYKQYKDETYEAQVSGIDPALDWIRVNQKTAYITNTVVKQKRWSLSVTAGPGVFWNGKEISPGAGIVIGGSYNF